MSQNKLTLLFINDKQRLGDSFTKNDIRLISKFINILSFSNLPLISDFFKNLFVIPKLIKIAKKCDFIYGWWLYNYTAVIVGIIARKPVILVSGGCDTANLPEIKYGELYNPFKKLLIKFNLRFLDYIRFVDKNLKTQLENNLNKKIKNYSILPTFYDSNYWVPGTSERKYILSVSTNPYKKKEDFFIRYLVKGIDRFIKLAINFPKEEFILLGYNLKRLKKYVEKVPPNLKVIEKLSKDKLLNLYQQTKIYCQFSRHEGFPSVVCEAMLCGCNIIASDLKGILSAINNYGRIINFQRDNVWQLINSEIFPMLLNKKNQINLEGRKYIIENYDEKYFKEKFIRLLKNFNKSFDVY